MSTEKLLAERGSKYGDYTHGAQIMQNILRACESSRNWKDLPDQQRSAFQLIALKFSRILNGDYNLKDNWEDVAGYAKLVADRIETKPDYPEYTSITFEEWEALPRYMQEQFYEKTPDVWVLQSTQL